jgi:hypothetical protein
MKHELERIKSDVHTIQQALGLAPVTKLAWIQWMKRDNWLNLWWLLPGLVLIVSALLPMENARYLGLLPNQWVGILVAALLLGITAVYLRILTSRKGRPESLIREYKRINGLDRQGGRLNLTLLLGLMLYFIWGMQNHIGLGAFWSGLFVFMGSLCLVLAVASRVWLLLGWAIPFIAYGLFVTLVPGHRSVSAIPLGLLFILVGLSFYVIQTIQVRSIEHRHGTD